MSVACRRTKGGVHVKESARRACPDCRDQQTPIGSVAAAPTPLRSSAPEQKRVFDRNWNSVIVTPGVIDDEAIRVYREGQCMAFAVEMAKALDSDRVMLLLSYDDAESTDPDDAIIHHAWAVSSDGSQALDIDEQLQVSFIVTSALIRQQATGIRSEAVALSIDDAAQVFGSRMVEQDYPLAASFAQVRAEDKRDELESREPKDGDARVTADGMISWHSNGQWSTPSRMPL